MLPDIIIMGPQGCGKGTQSELLRRRLHLHILGTGDIARGLSTTNSNVKELVQSGHLIPEKYIRNKVMKSIISANSRLIIDGMPRIARQARWLDDIMAKLERPKPILFLLNIDGREAVKRLSKRKICPFDNEPFYPKQKSYRVGICSKHNKKLIIRDDDKPQTVRYRLALYKKRQKAILDYYKAKNRLIVIDGIGSVKEVFKRLLKAVEEI